jgi:hypothetical protein
MSIAEMEATRDSQVCDICESTMRKIISAPALHGLDTQLMGGLDDGFGNDNTSRQIALAKARAAGVSTTGMKFNYGLCPKGEPFSPKAWYRDGAEARRKVRELGRCANGAINVSSPLSDADIADNEKPYRVSRSVVKEDVDREIAQCHGGMVSAGKKEELYSKYQDKHSGSKSTKGAKCPL